MKLAFLLFLYFCLIASYNGVFAQNPFLPPTAFIPDGEPHVFEYKGERRLFVYGSRDERVTQFCGYGHDVWSAPVDNLTSWTNHGEVFNIKQAQETGYGIVDEQIFGAPDCVYNPVTKKYYLYTFFLKKYKVNGNEDSLKGNANFVKGFEAFGPSCLVAESDSPVGPFVNPVICDWPASNEDGTADPSVLVDEQTDGSVRVFAFWGMKKGDHWAELDPNDMHTIIDPTTRKKAIDRKTGLVNPGAVYRTFNNPTTYNQKTSLFEASSIKRVADNKYVFVYSPSEKLSRLSYCYSNSPEGPWTYGGVIIDNSINWDFGNNHGSIACVNNQWYVIYHKKTTNDYNRQAMIEPIDLRIEDNKVLISQVEMTSQGIYTNGLDAFRRYNINTICYKTKGVIAGNERQPDGLNPLVGLNADNAVVGVKYLNFGEKPITDKDRLSLKLNVSMLSNEASVTVQLVPKTDFDDETKRITLGTFKLADFISKPVEYHNISLPLNQLDENKAISNIGGLKGQLGFLLVFNGSKDNNEICRIKEFEFAKGNNATPNPLLQVATNKKIENGRFSVLPEKARAGESVKITVAPNDGYVLKSVRVLDSKGNTVPCEKNAVVPFGPESYHFTMPESAVNVSAIFSESSTQKK